MEEFPKHVLQGLNHEQTKILNGSITGKEIESAMRFSGKKIPGPDPTTAGIHQTCKEHQNL
jgi:hypothetical protein